ncbi:LPS-assembly lipoprotein [Yoonia maricola]|uniref:LPS-assembly lipoprotein n=2 Tax=Yoonia maricola TaxID=420999 RepID=A0A2M8W0U4_9RHOB|nr:LPS-assembly lipoprotein [Yoonia maricola]
MLLISLMGLAGCGFAPVYSTSNGFRGRVAFETDESVAGFRLREQLEDRLGRSSAPAFVLKATVQSSQRSAAITSEGDTSRFNIIGTATWSLRDTTSGQIIDSGEVEAFTSYSATASTVATQATQDDAEARLSVILADLIVSRVLVLSLEPVQ